MIRDDLKMILPTLPAYVRHAAGSGVYLGTLGRLELNLAGYPFPGWSSADSRAKVADTLLDVVKKMRRKKWGFCSEIQELSYEERLLLLEREQLTCAMAARQDGVYVLLNDRQDTECYINDEEHLLIQTFYPASAHDSAADDALHAYTETKQLRDALVKKLPIAHDAGFGYLTSDPAKAGDGLFFSFLIHIPALRMARHMSQIQRALEELGVFKSPVFSSYEKSSGDIYMIHSPASAPGKSRKTLSEMKATLAELVKHELQARARLLNDPKSAAHVKEEVRRAHTTLKYAESLSYSDLLHSLSMLRLGLFYGLLQADTSAVAETMSRAYIEAAPASLCYLHQLSTRSERRKARAAYARSLALDKLHIHLTDSET